MDKHELLKLYDLDLEELVSIAGKITNENFRQKEIEVCSIISAKTGKCFENCKYCFQSIHNHADIICHPLLDVEVVRQAAMKAKDSGAARFCILTSGRSESGDDFKKIPYSPEGKNAFYEMLKEGQNVAIADSVNIEEKHLRRITEMTQEGHVFFNYPSSTLQDVKKHKPLEIDYIQGAIIRKGKKYNIKTPMNELVWSLLKIKEQG